MSLIKFPLVYTIPILKYLYLDLQIILKLWYDYNIVWLFIIRLTSLISPHPCFNHAMNYLFSAVKV